MRKMKNSKDKTRLKNQINCRWNVEQSIDEDDDEESVVEVTRL